MLPSLADNFPVDIAKLLETRLLIQASSGGGKSYALRRLLEQTAPHVQQLIIDPEGEFSTLREKHDYIIAAPKGGDAVANPKTAALLARRLLETGVSAVLDIYELRADERQRFVRLFVDALVNAPRDLWKPVMVVLDEAHIFCPQNGSAEASQSVIDIATRGRKRGQCLVLATQRLAKLHKDTAAEMLNKLIGLTVLDVDVKRAGDDLGLSAKDAMTALRKLHPGSFFAFGPALSNDITQIRVGVVETSHPKAGDRLLKAPPAPSPRIRAQLAKLADLQKDAEQEAKTIDELKAEIARLKREAKKPVVDEAEIERRVRAAVAVVEKKTAELRQRLQKIAQLVAIEDIAGPELSISLEPKVIPHAEYKPANAANGVRKEPSELRSGAVRILRELAARHPAGYSKPQVGALTKFSHKGGTFQTYLSDLRRSAYIEERDGLIYATVAGVETFGERPPSPATHAEVMAQWERALRAGAYKMLVAVVDAGDSGLHRANLADMVNMTAAGGTFNTYLSDLRRNGLISEQGKRLVANDILFPEGS